MRKQALLLLALGMAISGSACTGGNSGGPSVPVPVPPRVELGIMYASPGGVPLKLDAYLPGSPGQHPGVILIHGGAFRFGEREWETYLATALVDAGFAAFSIDYRLAPEFPFPAAVDDVLAAVAGAGPTRPSTASTPGRSARSANPRAGISPQCSRSSGGTPSTRARGSPQPCPGRVRWI